MWGFPLLVFIRCLWKQHYFFSLILLVNIGTAALNCRALLAIYQRQSHQE